MADVTVTSDVDTFMQSANQAAMRTNIGAGTIATQDANSVTITGGSVTGITDLAIADGGTGASTAATARTNLEVYSDAEVDTKVATKATAGGVYFETSGSADLAGLSVGTSDFSVIFNIKLDSIANQQLYNSHITGNNTIWIYLLSATSARIRWTDNAGVGTNLTLTFTNAVTTDVLYNFSFVFDRDGNCTFYLDGSANGSVSISSFSGIDIGSGNSNSARINASTGIANSMRDLRIFNRALTAAEVADLYESGTVAVADRWGVPGGATGCIADLPLDEGIGYQFHDRSSNHFDALASTSGVTHLVPKTEGYIRDFNVDAYNGGTGAFIVTSAQQMLPDNAMWSDLLIEDNIGGTNFSGSAFYVNDGSTGSNVLIASPVGITGPGGKVLSVAPSNVAITPSRNRLFLKVTDSTPDPASLNIRADYKQI